MKGYPRGYANYVPTLISPELLRSQWLRKYKSSIKAYESLLSALESLILLVAA